MQRAIQSLIALLLLAALAACGATPQGAASSETPALEAVATAAPAATGAPATTPTGQASAAATPTAMPSAPPTVTPAQESAMPSSDNSTGQQPAPSLPPLDRTSRPAPDTERVPTADSSAAVTGEVPQDLLDKIIADAAQRSGVDQAQIVVQIGQAVEWPDSSLGCAKPGVMYMQVITPGYQVVLDVGGAPYDYRANERGLFVLCQ